MLEAGAKWSRTNTNNNLEHRDSLDYKYVINHEKSTYFNYSEDIIAAYASLSYQFNNKWSSMLGIRAEYTDSYGDWISSKTTSKQKYVNFFPNLYIGYAPNKNWRLSAFYSLRINRPKFGQLNPYTIYIDANSIIVGNPNLKPQHTTDLSLNVGFKNFLNITFVSQITSSLISQIPSFDNVTGAKTLKWENFGKLYLNGGQISITEFELFKDYLYISASAFMSQAKNISNLDNYNTSSFFQQYNGTISLLLPKDLKIEVSTNYMGKLPYGYMQVEPSWTLDAGIKIDLFKKKATLSLNVNDILRTGETKIKMHDGDILNYYISQQLYTQRIKLGFIYNFGKLSAPRRTAKRDDTSSRVSK